MKTVRDLSSKAAGSDFPPVSRSGNGLPYPHWNLSSSRRTKVEWYPLIVFLFLLNFLCAFRTICRPGTGSYPPCTTTWKSAKLGHANSELIQFLKFKSQLTFAFFAAVNHFGGPRRKPKFTKWFVISEFRSVCVFLCFKVRCLCS